MSLAAVQLASTLAVAAALCAAPAAAQYVGQAAQPDKTPELRAVAVLEWVGDEQHPTRSRLVPVSIFDGQNLQDAGIYLARPQPLALDPEVEYELKQDGKNTGFYIVENADEEQGSWVGYGKWQALPKPKPPKPARVHDWQADDAASDQPVLHRKQHDGNSGSSSNGSGNPAEAPDPDRPTLHRSPDSGSDSASNSGSDSGSAPAPDPDRPTLHKSPDSDSGNTASSASSGGSGATDPDRPKLKKKQQSDDEPSVSSIDTTDPNRPKLMRGHVSYGGGDDDAPTLPALKGLPPEMHQAVAVSDARNSPEHPWDYSWANPDDEKKYKAQLEDLARTALGLNPPPAPAGKTASKTASKTTTHKSAKTAAPAPPPAPLQDEHFRVLELTYGSGATLVLSAHTEGTGAQEKFVTLIAQPDLYGNLAVLLKNTTDGAHLDDTPRMQLIDAVDAMADNRGELLFELRGQTQRQFALYRVLRGQVTKLFVSGGADNGLLNN
ncbi:MAG TPA: hypothetical protein VME23_22480 [Terracidiphilus sp.]|nr:hypothetical protein [Terracidiphilus sp.]